MALSISAKVLAPVDKTIGLPLEPSFLRKGRLLISAEATLKKRH